MMNNANNANANNNNAAAADFAALDAQVASFRAAFAAHPRAAVREAGVAWGHSAVSLLDAAGRLPLAAFESDELARVRVQGEAEFAAAVLRSRLREAAELLAE
jgi:hypothetical protein